MKVLVAYGTTEGQTQKIAHHVEASILALGYICVLHNCEDAVEAPDVDVFDAVIIAGSVHQQSHQLAVSDFVKIHLATLQAKPTAFLSVSLSITLADGQDEAQKYVTDFFEDTGWSTSNVHLAAGAIRFIEYDFFKKFTIEQIVMKGEKMPEMQEGNPEYTDWAALSAFVETFLDEATA